MNDEYEQHDFLVTDVHNVLDPGGKDATRTWYARFYSPGWLGAGVSMGTGPALDPFSRVFLLENEGDE